MYLQFTAAERLFLKTSVGGEDRRGRSTVLVNYLLSLPENAAAAGLKIPLHLRLRFKNINAWRQMACKSVLPR